MKTDILPKTLKSLWAKLAGDKTIRPLYLGGGTAMALHLKHRESIDLDFFQPESPDPERLVECLSRIGTLQIETREQDTLTAQLANVKVSFFRYPYPLLAPLHECEGISVADLQDLAAMKIIAIAQRGVKKDFVDLHALLQSGWNLDAIFQCVERKYTTQNYNKAHLLKSLTYFTDAESDPMPTMFSAISWSRVKQELEFAVQTYMRRGR